MLRPTIAIHRTSAWPGDDNHFGQLVIADPRRIGVLRRPIWPLIMRTPCGAGGPVLILTSRPGFLKVPLWGHV